MSRIQKRTKQVRDAIQREWHEHWWQFIIDNPDKDWNWLAISKNLNLTMEIILDNPDKPWDWYAISMNPNITMKDILDNPDKPWDWSLISSNPFTKDKEEFIIKRYREHLAAVFIQNAYKNALVNSNCQLGLNRIERDMVFAGII